jgi:hypothetical protein
MPLRSATFRGDTKLEACLVSHAAHITQPAVGAHVGKIHQALVLLDGATIAATELAQNQYGPSTAAAVLAYKTKRKIINFSYQQKADNIVGKMTIAALDDEMLSKESPPPSPFPPLTPATLLTCPHGGLVRGLSTNGLTFTASDAFVVLGCSFKPGLFLSPCFSVRWISGPSNPLDIRSQGLCFNAAGEVQGPVTIGF